MPHVAVHAGIAEWPSVPFATTAVDLVQELLYSHLFKSWSLEEILNICTIMEIIIVGTPTFNYKMKL